MLITICLVVVTAAAGLYIGTHPVVKNAYLSYREAHSTRKMIEQQSQERERQLQELMRRRHQRELDEFRDFLRKKGFPVQVLADKDLEEIAEITGWVFGKENTYWSYYVSPTGEIYIQDGFLITVRVWPKESPMN